MDQITTYSTLQSALAGMIHRADDSDITDNAPLFIQLCEADLNEDLLLKDTEQEDTLATSVGVNYIALPAGFVSPIAAWIIITAGQARTPLNPASPQELPYTVNNTIPQYWAIDGANLRFDCPADAIYSVPFRYVKSSNLSNSNTSNALLLKAPDVYLYGSLKQCALFQGDNEALMKWGTLYNAAKARVKSAENRSRRQVPLRTELSSRGSAYNITRDY